MSVEKPALVGSATVRLSNGQVLVAIADGRSWLLDLYTPHPQPLPLSDIAKARKSVVAGLVEGAILAGLRARRSPKPASYTLDRYIRWLAGNCVFAGQTPVLLRTAASGLRQLHKDRLADLAERKAVEESGHAELARRDLQSLGVVSRSDLAALVPSTAEAFVAALRRLACARNPVGVFGLSYCLERLALLRDQAFIGEVERLIPLRIKADRFLIVHSAQGSDSAHVNELLSEFDRLHQEDVQIIVGATWETASRICW